MQSTSVACGPQPEVFRSDDRPEPKLNQSDDAQPYPHHLSLCFWEFCFQCSSMHTLTVLEFAGAAPVYMRM